MLDLKIGSNKSCDQQKTDGIRQTTHSYVFTKSVGGRGRQKSTTCTVQKAVCMFINSKTLEYWPAQTKFDWIQAKRKKAMLQFG